jgi:hypothetical protein
MLPWIGLPSSFEASLYYTSRMRALQAKCIALISGFRRDVDEICGLLGNYTA